MRTRVYEACARDANRAQTPRWRSQCAQALSGIDLPVETSGAPLSSVEPTGEEVECRSNQRDGRHDGSKHSEKEERAGGDEHGRSETVNNEGDAIWLN